MCHDAERLALAAVGDDDLFRGLPGLGAEALDLLDDVHPLDDLAEHNVLAVEPRRGLERDEELAAVRVGACVCH